MKKHDLEQEELEDVVCSACLFSDRDCLFLNKDRLHGFQGIFKINRCLRCGLIYVSPRPKNIGKFYAEEYEPHNLDLKDFNQRLYTDLMEAYYSGKKGAFKWIKAQIYKLTNSSIPIEYKGKKVLDIGCGSGVFLYNLKRFGKFNVFGIDTSEYAVKQAREKLKLNNVTTGTLENNAFADDFFDVITLNHVIEHLPDPRKTLLEIKRILKNDGLLIITTPNAKSLLFKVFKKFWFPLETPRHLSIFSKKTLLQMADSIKGFKFKKIDYNTSYFILTKSLIYLFNIKNNFLINLLMITRFLLFPLFYFIPRGMQDTMTIYLVKERIK